MSAADARAPAATQDISRSKTPDSETDLESEKLGTPAYTQDAFGNEEYAEVKYKVLRWW